MLPAWSEISALSFQQEKQVTPGEGGMLLTDDDQLAEYAYIYHNDGRGLGADNGKFTLAGWNFRMSEFQGAIARVQLSRLDEVVDRKARNFDRLSEALASHGGGVRAPKRDPRMTRLNYLYPSLRYEPELMRGVPIGRFAEALRAEGIPCGGGGPGHLLHKHPLFAERRFSTPGRSARLPHPAEEVDYSTQSFPVAEGFNRGLVFPQQVLLGDDADFAEVIDAFGKVLEHLDELAAASTAA